MKKSNGYAIVNITNYVGLSMLTHIKEVFAAVSNSYTDEFIAKIALALNKVIDADYTFIARINVKNTRYKTVALVAKGEIADNVEYSLKNSPCANVADNNVCFYPKDVCSFYPEDQLLIARKAQAYLGTPLVNSKQQVIGLIVALYNTEQPHQNERTALLELFSGRITAELERIDYEKYLKDKLAAGTLELSETIEKLQLTQTQLVESEKMSALGNLVAGVSHEVNTPLGIAITTHSIMADELNKLKNKLDSQSLSMTDMENFRKTSESALAMQGENLHRAKKLIQNFKKTAADQHQLEIETLDIVQYYQRVISTLRSILKQQKVTIEIKCHDTIVLATYPGVHAQILTNLISNSVKHGFANKNDCGAAINRPNQENRIMVEVKQLGADEVEVIYSDNGRGLSDEAQQHVFDPFFTTARQHGGIGLGMSIVFNLINQNLNGSIALEKTKEGACFHYKFKEST